MPSFRREAILVAKLAQRDAQIEKLLTERKQLQDAYTKALFEIEKLRRGLIGPKSEKLRVAEEQLSLLEGLLSALPPIGESTEPEPEASPEREPEKKKTPHGRRRPEDLEHLPIVTLRLEPPMTEEQRAEVEEIGVDVSETIEYQPPRYVRLRVERPKLRLKKQDGTAEVLSAELPERGLKRSLAAPSLCAHVLVQKYADHLPLHRQESIFRRHGIKLARSTLSDWVQGCHTLLRHVVDAMWQDAKQSPWVGIDATGILIQQKEQCRRKSFFVLIAGRDHVLYHAAAREDRFEPVELLGGYQGYVIADASAIYHELYRKNEDVVEVGCWAHARRKFFEALSSDREAATKGIVLIRRLYEAHRASANGEGRWHTDVRARLAQPVLDELFAWVDAVTATPDDKTPLRLALNYLRNQREPLTRFLSDGQLRLDNNPSELALRREVIGRKNWLFCGSDEAAHWNTTVVSLIASCELHDIEPWAYLRDVLTLLPSWPANKALDLSPKHWSKTRERPDVALRLAELDLLAAAAGSAAVA